MAFSKKLKNRRQAGFSLIELMVALSVTVIGLIGLLSLHVSTMKGNRTSSHTAEAVTIGQQTIEELRGIPVNGVTESVILTYGSLPIANVDLGAAEGRAGMTYERRLDVTEIVNTNMVVMRVEVSWTDDGVDPASAPPELQHQLSFEIIRSTLEAL